MMLGWARFLYAHWINASLVACLLACAASSAWADVWGYVDAKGVAHFATEKVDERYELYFKGGTSFDTKDGLPSASSVKSPAATASMPRNVSVPKNAPKLLAFFDVSPNFKAVKHHLREASNTHKIDFELLQALIATESGFDTAVVSPKGAVGLMQLMPPTAQRYGVQADKKTTIEQKLTDPKINIKAGSRYLHDLLKMFPGNTELALAAYNSGEGAVKRYGNKIPPFPETQNYVKTVMQIYVFLKPPSMVANQAKPSDAKQPTRVRIELGGSPAGATGSVGGATGRGNMVQPLLGSPGANQATSVGSSTPATASGNASGASSGTASGTASSATPLTTTNSP